MSSFFPRSCASKPVITSTPGFVQAYLKCLEPSFTSKTNSQTQIFYRLRHFATKDIIDLINRASKTDIELVAELQGLQKQESHFKATATRQLKKGTFSKESAKDLQLQIKEIDDCRITDKAARIFYGGKLKRLDDAWDVFVEYQDNLENWADELEMEFTDRDPDLQDKEPGADVGDNPGHCNDDDNQADEHDLEVSDTYASTHDGNRGGRSEPSDRGPSLGQGDTSNIANDPCVPNVVVKEPLSSEELGDPVVSDLPEVEEYVSSEDLEGPVFPDLAQDTKTCPDDAQNSFVEDIFVPNEAQNTIIVRDDAAGPGKKSARASKKRDNTKQLDGREVTQAAKRRCKNKSHASRHIPIEASA
ncbi:Uu.00g078200.m01.CDS01 [Anthostomella pinea]|uniref:Uu.00g078200.m01.CDS01 n=1 Tax=Anthostomella pinea TaxID=933095 RepID=A0AAI8VKJ9_9PEZI|nr:Uu.00g078200.m01.CDS01 [Anthostomella pinea]